MPPALSLPRTLRSRGPTTATSRSRRRRTCSPSMIASTERFSSSETPVLVRTVPLLTRLDLAGAGPQGEQLGNALFSQAMHVTTALLEIEGVPVFPSDGDAEETCYQCHPGATTQCMRGAMANGGLECKDCHGTMRAVGGAFPLAEGGSLDGENDGESRRPWLDLPRCQSCHTGDALEHLSGADLVMAPDGIRLNQAYRTGDAVRPPPRWPQTNALPRTRTPSIDSARATAACRARTATAAPTPSGPMPIRRQTTMSRAATAGAYRPYTRVQHVPRRRDRCR